MMKGEIMKYKKELKFICFAIFLFLAFSLLGVGRLSASQAASGGLSATSLSLAPSIGPVIVGAEPAIYPPQEEVPISQIIRITFSKDMNQAATCSAFALYRISGAGTRILVEGSCKVEGRVLTFTPSAFLAEGSVYQVVVSRQAADTDGRKLQGIQDMLSEGEGDILWYFVTVADTLAPEITDFSPSSEGGEISCLSEFKFHIKDNNAGVNPSSLILKINGQQITPALNPISAKELEVVYSPAVPFGYGERVTVSIYVEDYVHNSLEQSYSFTTMRLPDRHWSIEAEDLPDLAAMVIDQQDHLWLALRKGSDGRSGGVKMFDGSGWRQYTSADGLGSDSATAIAVDSRGQVWVALNDAGSVDDPYTVPKLAKFDGQGWSSLSAGQIGVPADEEINEIAVDAQGHLWIATTKSGLIELVENSSLPRGLEDSEFEDIQVRAVAIGPDGSIWAGTAPYGVMRLGADGEWKQYAYSIHAREPVDFTVNDLAVDSEGTVWVATSAGLLKLDPGAEGEAPRWAYFIPNTFVNTVALDSRSGGIWIGTNKGLIRFDGQSGWVDYSADENKMMLGYPLSAEPVTKIAINPDSRRYEIWVAGTARLARRDENPPRVVSTSPANAAQKVAKNSPIIITFSEALDPNSVAFFSLYDSRHNLVSGQLNLDGNTLIFTLPPSVSLREGETYTLVVGSKMQDLVGNKLDGDQDGLGGEDEDTVSVSFTVEKKVVTPPASGGLIPPTSGSLLPPATGGLTLPSTGGSGGWIPTSYSAGGWSGTGTGFPALSSGWSYTSGWFGGQPSLFSTWSVPTSSFGSQFQNSWLTSSLWQGSFTTLFPQFSSNTLFNLSSSLNPFSAAIYSFNQANLGWSSPATSWLIQP